MHKALWCLGIAFVVGLMVYFAPNIPPSPPGGASTQRLNLNTEQIIVSAQADTVQQAVGDAVNEAFGLCLLENGVNSKGIVDAMTSSTSLGGTTTVIIVIHCRETAGHQSDAISHAI